jgi:hypothetical protein
MSSIEGINRSSRKEIPMRKTRTFFVTALTIVRLLTVGTIRVAIAQTTTPTVANSNTRGGRGPQYDTTHVYVAPKDFDRFVASLLGTFGSTATKRGVGTVTPTPSSTITQLVLRPVGTLSVFGFTTPIPYPFGDDRTGYLVRHMDEAIRSARATGAGVIVTPFNDPIGRDAIIRWHHQKLAGVECGILHRLPSQPHPSPVRLEPRLPC